MHQSENESHSLEPVCQQFEHWRQTREKQCPIPEKLWQAAESLYPDYSLHQISKALGLNYSALKGRIDRKQPASIGINTTEFIELKLDSPMQPCECLVEIKDPYGAKMKMHFKGDTGLDLLELGKIFLGRRS
jgi:hypothetical protein